MRVTEAALNGKMDEFVAKLFDKTDKQGYDVSFFPTGPTMWRVTIENLHEKDEYDVEYRNGQWSWIRVITAA